MGMCTVLAIFSSPLPLLSSRCVPTLQDLGFGYFFSLGLNLNAVDFRSILLHWGLQEPFWILRAQVKAQRVSSSTSLEHRLRFLTRKPLFIFMSFLADGEGKVRGTSRACMADMCENCICPQSLSSASASQSPGQCMESKVQRREAIWSRSSNWRMPCSGAERHQAGTWSAAGSEGAWKKQQA